MTFHHERRLDRALYHLESLKTRIEHAWREERPHRFVDGFRRQSATTGSRGSKCSIHRPSSLASSSGTASTTFGPPSTTSPFELAIAGNRGKPLPDKVAANSALPDLQRPRQEVPSRPRNVRTLWCIRQERKTIIMDLQPYNRGDRFWRDPLWHLNELSNIDKHRLPHVVLFAQTAPRLFCPRQPVPDYIHPIFYSIRKTRTNRPLPRLRQNGIGSGRAAHILLQRSVRPACPAQVSWATGGSQRLSIHFSDDILTRVIRPLRRTYSVDAVVQLSHLVTAFYAIMSVGN